MFIKLFFLQNQPKRLYRLVKYLRVRPASYKSPLLLSFTNNKPEKTLQLIFVPASRAQEKGFVTLTSVHI